MQSIRNRTIVVCLVIGLMIAASTSMAGSISLRWDAVPGASGYRVYYGSASQNYTQLLDVGNATTAALNGLTDCSEYFVAIKAYNSGGESAAYSNEISGWARPQIDTWGPGIVQQGDQVTLQLNGANFDSGASLRLIGTIPTDDQGTPLIRIDSYTVQGCGRILASLTIEPLSRGFRAMPVGALGLTFEVLNPDTVFGAEPATLTVQFNQQRSDVNRSDSSTIDRLDGQDLIWMRYAHGAAEGTAFFNPDADLDGDGFIDGDDLALFATNFGRCWTGTVWSASACQ